MPNMNVKRVGLALVAVAMIGCGGKDHMDDDPADPGTGDPQTEGRIVQFAVRGTDLKVNLIGSKRESPGSCTYSGFHGDVACNTKLYWSGLYDPADPHPKRGSFFANSPETGPWGNLDKWTFDGAHRVGDELVIDVDGVEACKTVTVEVVS
jgi:hypothetical protein